MDPLTKYLVYNKTPTTRHPMDYDTIKAQKKDAKEKGAAIDRRVLLLSPDIERVYEETLIPCIDLLVMDPLLIHAKIRRHKKIWYETFVIGTYCDPNNGSANRIQWGVHLYEKVRIRGSERVLYARNKLLNGAKPAVVGGKPISEELASDLRITCFSSASCPPRGEWIRTPLVMRPPDQPLGYGLAAPRNGARSLLSALQAHMIKWLLFDSRPPTKDNKCDVPPDTYLRPSEERQEEAMWRACSDVIWRSAGGFNNRAGTEPKAIVCLPSDNTYVQHSSQYYQDGVTEKLHLFEFKSLEDLQIFLKRYLYLFQIEDGAGALLVLYSCVLSRGLENVKKDLDGKLSHLVSAQVEGSINVVTLLLTGRATPYLHNGVLYVGDEDHYAMPQFGILSRSPVGLLVWYGGEENAKAVINKQFPGSRLKTPALPIWVTSCSGHYGVLFNTNRELLRNYHAERRFDIHYYTCGGCHVLLNVDTRTHDDAVGPLRNDDISATPLEKLIHTKWQDAKITWTGATPYVGESPK